MNTKRIGILLSILLISLFVLTGCSSIANTGKDVIGAVQNEVGATVVEAQTVATPTPAPVQLPTEHQDAFAIAQAQQQALADLYDRVSTSVVNIKVTVDYPDLSGGEGAPGGESPFNMPGLPGIPGMPGDFPPMRGEGSGWVYDAEGHIVTNNHVVADASDITVTFHDGRWAKGELVAADPQADLAVIKVTPPEGMDLQPLPLAEPDSLRVAAWRWRPPSLSPAPP